MSAEPEVIDGRGEERRERGLNRWKKHLCPHCGESIAIQFSIDIQTITKPVATRDWKEALTAEQIELVEAAKANGMFEAFCAVVKNVKQDQAPRNLEGFLVRWLAKAAPRIMPSLVLAKIAQEFPGSLEFIAADGIVCVFSDRVARMFMPLNLLMGAPINGNSKGRQTQRMGPNFGAIESWIRTKYGYVANGGELYKHLTSHKSIGEFARPGQ